MTLSDFRETFFDRYSAYPHETKQKAYLLFWGCCWAFISLVVFTICDLNWPIMKSPLKIIIASEGFFSILAFIGAIYTWKRKYDHILKVITVGLLLMIFSQYFASLKWFTETGIFTHRESFYILLATVALFHSRRSLLLLAGAIICTTTFMLLIVGSNFSPQIIPYVKQAIINGTAVIILVTLLLFFSSLINERSIRTANIELEKNKELNRNLDQKVKDRTIELEDKNNMLLNIENNLKKYLSIQLVETITKGGQEEIEPVSKFRMVWFRVCHNTICSIYSELDR